MKKAKYYSRRFLNKKEGIASIENSVEITSYCIYADVSLTDCNRKINLDFSIYSKQDYDEKMSKLELLINELAETYLLLAVSKDSWLVAKEADKLKKKDKKLI